jgi:hypothetical protein
MLELVMSKRIEPIGQNVPLFKWEMHARFRKQWMAEKSWIIPIIEDGVVASLVVK